VPAAPSSAAADDAETIRIVPQDMDLVQLLPGRLEVVQGADSGQEIRFVRSYSNPDAEYTLGRVAGRPHHHIRLNDPTVSRSHARMRFLAGCWQIENLSQTNPIVVNGQELAKIGSARQLADGDHIELGKLLLLFREGTS
jgi:pSer/pThr/pTyr-binding forkhead associated (FHA) protein